MKTVKECRVPIKSKYMEIELLEQVPFIAGILTATQKGFLQVGVASAWGVS